MAIVQFLPRLYGGGRLKEADWHTLQEKGVDTVINVRDRNKDVPPKGTAPFTLLYWPLDNDIPPSLAWTVEHLSRMQALYDAGHSLYVHDTAGRNRLGFMLAAFYMGRFRLTAQQALREARRHKPDLAPNRRYRRLLEEYERYLFSGFIPNKNSSTCTFRTTKW